MKHFRMLAAGLCSAVLLCGFAIPAYAYSDGGNEEPPVVEETPAPEPAPTITPGEGFSEDGNLVTRDLLYDAATNKQFITVETSGGNTFYIVIDYDKPVDEDGEQYHTYFLNMVDEADLLAALEAAGGELPACSCTEKCAPGAIHTDCEVCAVNMTECAGTAPEPAPVTKPAEEPEPEPQQKSNTGTLLLILAVAVLGSGAGWYFKIYRPKHEKAAVPEEDYSEELADYDDPEDNENYYLLAWDAKAALRKHYRVDKMTDISALEVPREGAADAAQLDLSAYSQKVFSMFSGEEQTVRLRFANHLVGAVLDRFGKDVIVVADGPEHFKVTLNVVTSPKFYAWLFGFGTEVEILSPPSARQEMQRMLTAAAQLYAADAQS